MSALRHQKTAPMPSTSLSRFKSGLMTGWTIDSAPFKSGEFPLAPASVSKQNHGGGRIILIQTGVPREIAASRIASCNVCRLAVTTFL